MAGTGRRRLDASPERRFDTLALPDVFQALGLERIRVESFSHVFLLSDERHDPMLSRAYLQGKLRFAELYRERDLSGSVIGRAGPSAASARAGTRRDPVGANTASVPRVWTSGRA